MEIQKQPTDDTCGATTLHAMYQYLGVDVPIDILVKTITQFPNGGTADVCLAMDALERGLKVSVYTSNIRVFEEKRTMPDLLANHIVGVQPVSGPIGFARTLRKIYGSH